MREEEKISMALLAQAGIDPVKARVLAVSFHHRVGEVPTLTVEHYITRLDGEFDTESTVYEWREKQ